MKQTQREDGLQPRLPGMLAPTAHIEPAVLAAEMKPSALGAPRMALLPGDGTGMPRFGVTFLAPAELAPEAVMGPVEDDDFVEDELDDDKDEDELDDEEDEDDDEDNEDDEFVEDEEEDAEFEDEEDAD